MRVAQESSFLMTMTMDVIKERHFLVLRGRFASDPTARFLDLLRGSNSNPLAQPGRIVLPSQ